MSILKKLRDCNEPLNVKEVAKLLCVSEATIQRWVRGREIPALRIGDTIRFDGQSLADFIEEASAASQHSRDFRYRLVEEPEEPLSKDSQEDKN
jgi:excisionase family DNA binding protein